MCSQGRRSRPTGDAAALRKVLEKAGVEFTNGDAPGGEVEDEMTSPESALHLEVVEDEIVVSLPEGFGLGAVPATIR